MGYRSLKSEGANADCRVKKYATAAISRTGGSTLAAQDHFLMLLSDGVLVQPEKGGKYSKSLSDLSSFTLSQTWVGYISLKIYILEYIRFEDIFTGYNIIVKNRIYDRDILRVITKYIIYPFLWAFWFILVYLKKIFYYKSQKNRMFQSEMVAQEEKLQ